MINRIPRFYCRLLTVSSLLTAFIRSNAGSSSIILCDSHVAANRNVNIEKVAEPVNKSITCSCEIYSNSVINAKINMSLARTTRECSERLKIKYHRTENDSYIWYERCSNPENYTTEVNNVLPIQTDLNSTVLYTWTHQAEEEVSGYINIKLQSLSVINVTCHEAEDLSNVNDVRLLIIYLTVLPLLALVISFIVVCVLCLKRTRKSEKNIKDESAIGYDLGYEEINKLKHKEKHKKKPGNPGKRNGQKNEEEQPEVVYSLPLKSAKKKKENEEETSLQEKAADNEYTSIPVPVKSWERSEEEVVDKIVNGDAEKDEI